MAQNKTDSSSWQRIPLVTEKTLAAGFVGGEGGQWPRSIAVSASEPDFLMFGTDVGGIYRSFDGGGFWQICMTGWETRGGNAFAIDPRNAKRIIGVGGNSHDFGTVNGLFLSTDQAASWRQVLPMPDGHNGSVAYDPASFNAERGYCTLAYFSSNKDGIFRSSDGGETWEKLTPTLSKSKLQVHPSAGVLYAANGDKEPGLWRSDDRGANWRRVLEDAVHGVSVIPGRPDHVYVSGKFKVMVSGDRGETWKPAGDNAGLPDGEIRDLAVSPADPQRMLAWHQGANWNWVRLYTQNGGNTWQPIIYDNTHAFLPRNARQGYCDTWHPTDPNVAWSIGGDWLTKSTDGGKTFAWSSNGENAIMLGRSFNFSPTSPDTICLFFQDYAGAFSDNGGKTWRYMDVAGKGWGGFNYAGYAPNGQVMYGGDADSWGGKRHLIISRDGGTTWGKVLDKEGKPLMFRGFDVGYSSPTNPKVMFASNWRSEDGGETWHDMTECDGVFIHNFGDEQMLFGKKGDCLLESRDEGKTWTIAEVIKGGIRDLAYDHVNRRYYVISENKLKVIQKPRELNVPATYPVVQAEVIEVAKDQLGRYRFESVAVDPVNPNIVYVCGPGNNLKNTATILRSTDAGKTWENLTYNEVLTDKTTGGPFEVAWVRVHPKTREAWVNGQCFGMWKIGAP